MKHLFKTAWAWWQFSDTRESIDGLSVGTTAVVTVGLIVWMILKMANITLAFTGLIYVLYAWILFAVLNTMYITYIEARMIKQELEEEKSEFEEELESLDEHTSL